ncbi:hypothetical protein [Streptomyces sp. NPDC097619]|uniref:hypothetical protein n=1 Tax=Streptomyces sp. NPDC097619 TaxID=3157228 RepID=UPI00331A5342
MTAAFEQYTREMHEKFGYFAAWAPNTPLALGDVGTVRGHRFDPVTSLTRLEIPFAESSAGPESTFSYLSAGQVHTSVSPEVTLPAVAGAVEPSLRLTVTFSRAKSTFFQAVRCETRRIADLAAVETGIRERMTEKLWKSDYVVVTELVRTGPAVILVSSRADTRVELEVSAELVPAALPLGGAAIGLGSGIDPRSGLAAQVITPEGGLTPLFRGAGMRRPGIGRRRLRVRSHDTPPEVAERRLTPLSWAEFSREPIERI